MKIIDFYPYQSVGANKFIFFTSNSISYTVEFVEYWQQDLVSLYSELSINVYELFFIQSEEKNGIFDPKISTTLFKIIDDFLTQETIVYYITERIDGRARELFRVYQLWYLQFKRLNANLDKTLIKFDRKVYNEYDQVDAYVSIVLTNDWIQTEKVEELFEKLLSQIFPNTYIK